MSNTDNTFRFYPIQNSADANNSYRSEYRRDYGRVLHSPSFRRLQNKTQLFPGYESDFFRNRLTHSLEVAQIAKSIAFKLKKELQELEIEPDVCEIAGLLHDIGHPPFGHNGEAALDKCMISYGGFEGNAQTLRIITRLEKKEQPESIVDDDGTDCRVGLNLTARVIASVLKYDCKIPVVRNDDKPLVKGYYESEKEIVDKVKCCIIGNNKQKNFKTIECSIMDLADDIAYSTYDMEDAFKAEFLTPYGMMAADNAVYRQIVDKLKKDNIQATTDECRAEILGLFADVWHDLLEQQKQISAIDEDYETKTLSNFLTSYRYSISLAQDGYKRTQFTSYLVNSFIDGVKVNFDSKYPVLSKVYLDEKTKLRVNILKHFSYIALINSSRLKVAENRGHEIVTKMFERLNDKGGYLLLPEDFQHLYCIMQDELGRKRLICDFIAGMTDRYAMEFYDRLFSDNPQSIFKPL